MHRAMVLVIEDGYSSYSIHEKIQKSTPKRELRIELCIAQAGVDRVRSLSGMFTGSYYLFSPSDALESRRNKLWTENGR